MSTSTRRLGLGAFVFVFLGLPVLVVGGSRLLTERVRGPREAAQLRPEAPAELLADLRRLQGQGLLAGRGTSADAAPELNRLFGADGAAEGAGQAPWAERDFFAELDAVRHDGGWLEHPEVTSKYDVSFLAGWARYDHWAWDAAEPYRAALTTGDTCPLSTAIPNYIPATSIARVRLAQALAAGDLRPAAAEVEHLAMLVASTDTLVGNMVAVGILKHELAAVERAQAAGVPAPELRWTEADVDRFRAALAAFPLLFEQGGDDGTLDTLAQESAGLPGACGALADAVVSRSVTRTAVWSPWPGEVDQGRAARRLDAALGRSGCALPYVRSVWASDGVHAACMAGEDAPRATWALSLPYLRGPLVATLEGLAAWGQPGPYGATAPADHSMQIQIIQL